MNDRSVLRGGASRSPARADKSWPGMRASRSAAAGLAGPALNAAYGHDFSRIRVHDGVDRGVIHRQMEDMMYNPDLIGNLPSFGDIAGGIGGGISTLGGMAGDAASGIGSYIGGGISGAADLAGGAASGIGSLFGAGSTGEQIGNIAGSAISGIGGVLGGRASNIGSNIGSSISGAASSAGEFVSGLPGMVSGFDPSWLMM